MTTSALIDRPAGEPKRRSPLRVLSLLPVHATRVAHTTFLAEESRALSDLGVELHAVSHRFNRRGTIDAFIVHPVPLRPRGVFTLRALPLWLRQHAAGSLAAGTLRESLWLAREQQAIADVVRRENIQLIHSHWAEPSGTAGVAARQATGVPLVIHLRGIDVLAAPEIEYGSTLDPWFRRRISIALRAADRIIAVSQAVRDRALELGASPDRVVIVEKGVDLQRFHPGDAAQSRRALGLDQRPTVLFVGHFQPYKNVLALLQAFRIVRRQVPHAQLVMCGDGPLGQRVADYVREHQLEGHVGLPGRVARSLIPEYFRACDVFVLCSVAEGSGNVLVEASASGRPTVGSRAGGIPDYVVDGQTGLLCDPTESDIADKLTRLLCDPQLARQMGQAARARAQQRFGYPRMIDEILDVYDQAIQCRRTRAGRNHLHGA